MESITDMNLYLDGTRAYTRVAHSFATFGGSYAPGSIQRLSPAVEITASIHHDNETDVGSLLDLPAE